MNGGLPGQFGSLGAQLIIEKFISDPAYVADVHPAAQLFPINHSGNGITGLQVYPLPRVAISAGISNVVEGYVQCCLLRHHAFECDIVSKK